jgi:isopentenyl phosphate kinase
MLFFLKLGGSIITNKDIPFSARKDVIQRLGEEIAQAIEEKPNLKLLIGHGSGSFGHAAAHQFGTRDGIRSKGDWLGFQKVWTAAHQLNQIVVEIFSKVGLPVVSFPPSASLITVNHEVKSWMIEPIKASFENNLLPIIFGDVVFDRVTGATILSTEELFSHLASKFHPDKILLAGIEGGVFRDFPKCHDLIEIITPALFPKFSGKITISSSTDVTGGMKSKVQNMMELIQKEKNMTVQIFSGEKNNSVYKALCEEKIGTLLSSD